MALSETVPDETAAPAARKQSRAAHAQERQPMLESPDPPPRRASDPFAVNPQRYFRADCASRPVLDQIADKWSMMVMAVLEEPTRFNELKRRLDGVTQRVLTQTLRRLERNGMIERLVLPTSPVGVQYALTPMGESLREPFGHLYTWTIEHSAQIRSHQELYDRKMAGGS